MGTVLLLGAGGQLGALVAGAMPASYKLHAYTREALDITDKEGVNRVVAELNPDAVINCAAYTTVDRAEQEKETAFRVNAEAVANLAGALPDATRLIHLSTDFVFSESSDKPYTPDAKASPSSVYGASKLAGENRLLRARTENSFILRTSWLYSAFSRNFVTTMLELMKNRDLLTVVNDQYGSPTSAHTLAEIIWKFVAVESGHGIYHWSDEGVITWYDFALEIYRQGRELGLLEKEVDIQPVPSEAYPTAAVRPRYSALDVSTTEALLSVKARPWQSELNNVLKIIARETLS